jgi:hypothetical protein
MPYKLAITVAGAVSLGAYEAGVLYEVIDAISQHNQHPATSPADQVVIDVLTGASAGGMSAALLAQKLLFEKDSLAGPYTNMLYRAWVAISVDASKYLGLATRFNCKMLFELGASPEVDI